MKNFINQGIGLLDWFADKAAQQVQTACMAATMFDKLFNASLRVRMRDGCREAFKPHQVSFALASELLEAKIQLSLFGLLNTIIILRRLALSLLTSYLYLMQLARWPRLSRWSLP
jgi:hypothetical protein